LLLLHGTGGDENDLISLGRHVAPGAALISPRGKVLEGAMPRFFRRVAEGVWDIEDLHRRTEELAAFVARAREIYKLGPPIAVGYSNGANIAWSLLLRRPDLLAGAALLRAMLPFDPPPAQDLGGVPVLVLAGAADPVVPAPQRDRLAALLKQAGADVTYHVIPAGHGLTERDLDLVREWLAERRS
jgi:phospholipase/carboxylesterase